ncbi:MAG: NAD(P)/FAD-dependent oxidoreductase [Planctomycetes bacterium]|nr:NAD(P)/FAD-dependent oxidoreductase [Planctomycetota bacterium]
MPGASDRPHVVIIGGGFGGLYAAKALKGAPVRITLIDRRNHHLFQPLLYQVATAALAAPDIAAPIRKILRRQRNVTVLLDEAREIDTLNKRVRLSRNELVYDYLIVAAGATHSYFGHDDWADYAPGLKTIGDAFEIRRKVLMAYERAEGESDPQRRQELLTFVVVGAGPTGVELAGALSEIARRTLARDFRNVNPGSAKIVLMDASDRVLPAYEPGLSDRARLQLEDLGVEIHTGVRVTNIDSEGVHTGDSVLKAGTVLWAAGVQASPLGRSLRAPQDRAGRVLVEPTLSIAGHSEVLVIGDQAAVKYEDGWVPGVAPAAIQMGRHAANNIRRALRALEPLPFHYADKGMLATIGRSRAVAQIGRMRFSGWVAWMLWLCIHIFFLIGFRNRLAVMLDWMWAYFTFQRSARIIMEDKHFEDEPAPSDVRRAG